MLDGDASSLLNIIYFMKQYGAFAVQELEELYEFEFEIYYFMALRDMKTREEAAARANNG